MSTTAALEALIKHKFLSLSFMIFMVFRTCDSMTYHSQQINVPEKIHHHYWQQTQRRSHSLPRQQPLRLWPPTKGAQKRISEQNQSCINLCSAPRSFLIIGHAGGDPVNHCENTLEATKSALEHGANAIELDLAISKDNVVFLWHDPSPFSLHTIARRLGFTLSGRCRPSMSVNSEASQLEWSEIRQHWFYDDMAFGGHRSPLVIPTLSEWMNEFAQDSRIQLIWLDVKVKEVTQIANLVRSVVDLLHQHAIPAHRIQFSVHEPEIGRQLQKELLKYGLAAFASKVVADTVPYTTFLTDVHNYNGVGKALEPISKRSKIYDSTHEEALCGCCANLGRPLLGTNRWMSLQKLVNFNVAQRNWEVQKSSYYVNVFVWTIDDPQQMAWLLQSGVDGIITNRPKLLVEQFVRQIPSKT